MKKKVLFVHHAVGIGGAPISMIETINGLDKEKYEVEVLLIKDSIVGDLLRKNGIKCRVVESWFYRKYYHFFSHIVPAHYKWYQLPRIIIYSLRWILSRYYFSYRVLGSIDYDIVHFNSSVLSDWLCAGSRYGKAIIHVREPLAAGYLGLRKLIITFQMKKYAAHIIAISKDNARRIGLEYKTTVVYNFTQIPEQIESGFGEVGQRVLYLGGDNIAKGYLTVVDALDHLDEGVEIIFCGGYRLGAHGNSLLEKLRNLFRLLLPKNRALVAATKKMISHPKADVVGLTLDVNSLLKKCAFLISPFTEEHFSRPVIEAFANGRAAIATNIEGMDEIIDDGINGLLVQRGNPIALANAINYLIANPVLMRRMGVNGNEKAQAMFSPKNIKNIEEIYDSLV